MRRWKVLLAALALAAIGFAIWFATLPRSRTPSNERVHATAGMIERGRYLVINVLQCVDCHSVRDWTKYGGPPLPPIGAGRPCMNRQTEVAGVNVGQENFPGQLCIRNITQDLETGIGAWTDGEIMRAVREGVGRDGQGLFPIMPYFIYRHLADDDLRAVIAYLRTMPAVRSARPARQIDFPLNLLVRLWPEPVTEPIVAPRRSDTIRYGEYLARIARCEFCHTPRDPNSLAGFPDRHYAGGMPFFLGRKNVKYSKNLTPHETGLGPWSQEMFIARFRQHATPATVEPLANTLMNWNAFSAMTDEDLIALYQFFRTLPPVALQLEPIKP